MANGLCAAGATGATGAAGAAGAAFAFAAFALASFALASASAFSCAFDFGSFFALCEPLFAVAAWSFSRNLALSTSLAGGAIVWKAAELRIA
eukprot:CAMPEP_0197658974 /NCGR_PEP_ID=MMETSP1338-20131121/45639_1 /TAXON_ID=43686 ORGANISM="Pelagodinium beii, Strain RCC1491" /NCGR_SAMPLE_ID=MMETSP1338 /ASSEMBLY_ACC=CAM_ASM_000754 /LENGTH=91 /DNA_ID=CAMNT_0043235681 /DNA_START=564 /DNA_END=835 /DNA_ORIENTATION=+